MGEGQASIMEEEKRYLATNNRRILILSSLWEKDKSPYRFGSAFTSVCRYSSPNSPMGLRAALY